MSDQIQIQAREALLNLDDHLVTATSREGRVRCVAAWSTKTIQTACRCHDLSPLATIAMGRFGIGAQLMAATLKNPTDVMSMTLKCEGPLKGMVVVSDYQSNIRGYVQNEHADVPPGEDGKIHFREVVGAGTLTVVKDMGLKTPYSGTVKLISGEIAEDLAFYLMTSEQLPSVLATTVLLHQSGVYMAGGLLIQLMPGATAEDLSYIEQRASGFPELGFLMNEGFTPKQWIDLFMGDPNLHYLETHPIAFKCHCSEKRMTKNLLALGKAELEALAADPKGIDLHCHFCNRHYAFSQERIRELISCN